MIEPVVSICMITYNHQNYIAQAIEGVLIQQCDFPFELVIGDDFSKDNSRKIAEKYTTEFHNKIKLLSNSGKNLGPHDNFIRTYKACKGKYIALCEGDDYWTDPLKLQKQVGFLEQNPQFAFTAHAYHTVNSNNAITLKNTEELERLYPEGKVIDKSNVFDIKFSKTLTLVFRRSAVTEELFNYPELTDTVLKYHLINKADGFWLPKNMGAYRLHESNVFGNFNILKKLEHSYQTWSSILKQKQGDMVLAKTMFSNNLNHLLNYYVHPNNRYPFQWRKLLQLGVLKLWYSLDKKQAYLFLKQNILPVLWLKFKMNLKRGFHV